MDILKHIEGDLEALTTFRWFAASTKDEEQQAISKAKLEAMLPEGYKAERARASKCFTGVADALNRMQSKDTGGEDKWVAYRAIGLLAEIIECVGAAEQYLLLQQMCEEGKLEASKWDQIKEAVAYFEIPKLIARLEEEAEEENRKRARVDSEEEEDDETLKKEATVYLESLSAEDITRYWDKHQAAIQAGAISKEKSKHFHHGDRVKVKQGPVYGVMQRPSGHRFRVRVVQTDKGGKPKWNKFTSDMVYGLYQDVEPIQ